jgi:putative hydrolases of HD superfamily
MLVLLKVSMSPLYLPTAVHKPTNTRAEAETWRLWHPIYWELVKLSNAKLGGEIRAAWLEYEEGKTAEARFIRENDKFECLIQAFEYEQRTHGKKDLEEFQGLSSKVVSSEGKSIIRVVAAGETSSLLKAKTANSCYLRHRYNLLVLLNLGADDGTGVPDVGKKTQCALLSKGFGFQHTCLNDVLREKSNDQTYLHAKFVKECLEEKVNIPTDLAISLLETKINKGIKEGNRWILVYGFPESMHQLLEFEEKVSITYVDRALLTPAGAKNKLHTTSDVLSRGNAQACRKEGPIFRYSQWRARCREENPRFPGSECGYRESLESSGGVFQDG